MATCKCPPAKVPDLRSKSCDTACSSNSSCFFQKRKPTNPLAHSLRSTISRSTNSVRQRVLSAKYLKLKTVQNQLNDTNFHLAEVIRENQALRNLQKRQDRALNKYEGTNAELPRLIKSHEEEIRVLTETNKTLRKTVRELNDQLKHRNDELLTAHEQLKHLERLDKDKHLLEREKLVDELEEHQLQLKKAHSEIVTLNRRLLIETKTSKQRLNMEMSKHKQCQKELTQSLVEIGRLANPEAREKRHSRFTNLPQRQTMSLVSLNGAKPQRVCDDLLPVTEVKLEPIKASEVVAKPKGILKCPSESIKARLSAGSVKAPEDDAAESKVAVRPNSSLKLEKIEMNLQNSMRKGEDNEENNEFEKRLGDYCMKAIDTVKNYDGLIDHHKGNLEVAKTDTSKLLDSFKETEDMEVKLRQNPLIFSTDMSEDNLDFVSQILTEELKFQRAHKDRDKNGNKKESSEKKKLLATLRAIDNGDSVDSAFEQTAERNHKLMSELFGSAADD